MAPVTLNDKSTAFVCYFLLKFDANGQPLTAGLRNDRQLKWQIFGLISVIFSKVLMGYEKYYEPVGEV